MVMKNRKSMKENISYESLSRLKYRKSNEKMIIFLYSSIILAIGISSTCYGASFQHLNENNEFVNVFYSVMFLTSSAIIISIWIYLFKHRNETFEALKEDRNSNLKLLLSQRGEKVNLYLRFGLTIFGMSSLVYIGMKKSIRYRESRSSFSNAVYGVIEGFFIVTQTTFILFNHRLVILSRKKIMKLAFVHLIITNILMWADCSIGKISSDFQHSKFCSKHKYDVSCNLYIYFLPAVSEYAVIVAAILYEIYTRIGKYNLIKLDKKNSKKSLSNVNSRTIISIISAIIIILICLFTSISSVVLHILEIDPFWINHVHNCEIILINLLSIIVLSLAYMNSRKLKFSISVSNNSLDKNILLISYIFSLNFTILAIFICGYSIVSIKKVGILSIIVIRLFSGILEIIQATVQTHFLVDASKRCSFTNEQMEQKPGRNLLIVLIGLNTGMWFLCSLQIKNADILYYKDHDLKRYELLENKENSVTGLLARFFLQSTLPLLMLYRYHSSACLSEFYTKIYHTEAMRFENHLRAGKLGKKEMFADLSKDTQKNNKYVSFGVNSVASNKNLSVSENPNKKKRSQSVIVMPNKVVEEIDKKFRRRETIKNMEEAHYKIMSAELSFQMLNRQINSKLAFKLNSKNMQTTMPNIHKMVRSGFFAPKYDLSNETSDTESAYSI